MTSTPANLAGVFVSEKVRNPVFRYKPKIIFRRALVTFERGRKEPNRKMTSDKNIARYFDALLNRMNTDANECRNFLKTSMQEEKIGERSENDILEEKVTLHRTVCSSFFS